jgi:sugar lactone lactonase YvrE
MVDIRQVVACGNVIGEGPLWDVDEQRLYWLDSMKGQIWRCAADGGEVRQWQVEGEIGSMALRRRGGAVLALNTGIHLFDFATGRTEFVVDPEADLAHTRLNDGKVDRQGRFVVGSLDMAMYPEPAPEGPRGSLYRLDPDLSLHKVDTGIACSNGPCFSPDGRTLYFTDSFANRIYAYDWDTATGTASNKRLFTPEPGRREIPDGATVDAEGCYWNALNAAGNGVGEVRRYAPDGSLLRKLELPSLKVTSLMFGGPDLDVLYVTSMGMAGFPEDRPQDGNLFAVHGLGVRGLPEPRFAG